MSDRRGLLYFLAIQKIFCNHPGIARSIIAALPEADIFEGDRRRLKEFFGDHAALWGKFRDFKDWDEVKKEYEAAQKLGVKFLPIVDENYPALLKETYDPPLLIYMKGECGNFLSGPAVAIVGSRKATCHGLRVAATLAEGLAGQGLVIVSGMAYGIDAAAHRGALAASGKTAAVLGCGVDIAYPSAHADLARKIYENGVIISEFPVGTLPYQSNFPQRNRIISGLCVATIIVEAAERSGSLITARLALEQGREVMAVPGPAGHQVSRGTNSLIKEGAALIETAEDVMNLISARLPDVPKIEKTGHFETDVDKDSKILDVLKRRDIFSVDEIITLSQMSSQKVCEELTKLAVTGRVEELPGRMFRLKKTGI